MENITEIWGKSIFKYEPYFCQWIPFFRFFQIFFKVEVMLPYSESIFFNILYPASANVFFAYGNSSFLVRALLLLLEIISVIKRKWQFFSFSGNVYFNKILWKGILWLVETAFIWVRGFSSQWRPIVKKQHILTNVSDSLASGIHFFFSFSQTIINCCQWKQFIVQLEHIFQPILKEKGYSISQVIGKVKDRRLFHRTQACSMQLRIWRVL